MPNRLKVSLDLGTDTLVANKPLHASLAAQWLSGATAAGLKADVKMGLTPTATHFSRFADYTFDDPAREFSTKPEAVFEGVLDSKGEARFEKPLELDATPPGMLTATFTTRVFEKGGTFSINRQATTYAPYAHFVGIRLPKGDAARDMLLTDQQHTVEIATLSANGAPVVSARKVQVTLYKVEWKWWWDKTGDSLAQYAQGRSNTVVREDTVSTVGGKGQWNFEIKYPEWGRYLVRACDTESGDRAATERRPSGQRGNPQRGPAREPPAGAQTPPTAQDFERAEQDVLFVTDLVAKEYNADPQRIYLMGNSSGGSAVWAYAVKFPQRWTAISPSAAPLEDASFPYEKLRKVPVLVVHGDQDSTMVFEGSKAMVEHAKAKGVLATWLPVTGGMHTDAWAQPEVIKQIFDFFDAHKKKG
jgi:predicted esterase